MSNDDTTTTNTPDVDADAALAAGPLEGERPWHDPTQEIFDREQARADARRSGDELVDDDTTEQPSTVAAPQNAGTSVTSGHATATVTPGNLANAQQGDQTATATNPTGSPAP